MNILSWYRNLSQEWQLVLAGAVTGLSFPPVSLALLAWVGLVPLIRAWLKSPSPSRSGYYGFFWAMGYLFVTLYWVAFNNGTHWWAALASMIALVLVLSLNYIFIGWWFGWLHARWGRLALWSLPLLWVSVEFLRSFGTLGFPWVALANSQTVLLLPIQNAEITGIYGISLWVVLMNVLLVEYLEVQARQRIGLVLVVIILFPWVSGWLLLPEVPPATFTVGVVQPNVNALEKWVPEIRRKHFDQLNELTYAVAVDSPQVVFWPEAATPAYLRKGGRSYLRNIQEVLRDVKFPVVTGMPDYWRQSGEEVHYYNAVGYIDSLGLHEQYNKIKLVPFGEYIPLSGWIPALKVLNLGQGNFTKGDAYTVFEVDSIPFSVGICYETTFPWLNRNFVRAGATFLVGVVNDAWYQTSSGPYQHAAQFRYRAVELRRPVVRAANTGISLVIDQAGRTVARLGLNEEGVFTAGIAPATGLTFYARYGDLFAWLTVLAALGSTGWAYRDKLSAWIPTGRTKARGDGA